MNMADYSLDMLKEGCLFTDWENPQTCRSHSEENRRKELRITTPAGTDFWTSIEGRHADVGYGTSIHKGEASSPPDAECAVGPVEDTARGVLVIDGSIPLPGLGIIKEPIRIEVEDGYLRKIEGGRKRTS